MNEFLLGTLTMAAAVVGLYFLKFWKKRRDPLFLFFSAAFWLMSVNWLCLALVNRDEPNTALYAIRLFAFVLIMLGVWNKNRRPKTTPITAPVPSTPAVQEQRR